MVLPLTASRPTFLIVDDHAVVREGLMRILRNADPAWNVVEAEDARSALGKLLTESFDLAVVDLSMPGMSGLELIKRLHQLYPHLKVLVLSMHAEEQYALRALRAGARGYVTKDGAGHELAAAVRKVLDGGIYLTPNLAERVILQMTGDAPAPGHDRLSDRELEVLRRLVAGERPGEIADALHLSVKTVSTHKSRIQEKLGLPGTAALVRYGLEHGLLAESAGPSPVAARERDEEPGAA
ncbi:MAG: response regulator transcription factor [Burkholderiales bacterium]|nr:response regulator transcription factor [Burkholderiales bacterium]